MDTLLLLIRIYSYSKCYICQKLQALQTYVPELFPANNSRMYQNCQNNSGLLCVPELLIQAILGLTRIVREFFTCRLNNAISLVLSCNVSGVLGGKLIEMNISGTAFNYWHHSASSGKIIHGQFWYVPEL